MNCISLLQLDYYSMSFLAPQMSGRAHFAMISNGPEISGTIATYTMKFALNDNKAEQLLETNAIRHYLLQIQALKTN